jgi:tetratricopeptide (TPR) repeat protein
LFCRRAVPGYSAGSGPLSPYPLPMRGRGGPVFEYVFSRCFLRINCTSPASKAGFGRQNMPPGSGWLPAARVALTCMGVAALFSYPLQNTVCVYFFIACLLLYCHYTYQLRPAYNRPIIRFVKNGLIAAALLLHIANTAIKLYSQGQTRLAVELSAAGYKTEALEKLQRLNRWPTATAHSWFQQAFLLQQTGQLQQALRCLNRCQQYHTNNITRQLMGDIYYDLKDTAETERHYQTAVYMAPNRLRSKYHLMMFYKNTGQLQKARHWQRIILSMPVKIASAETQELLRRVKEAF